MVKLLLNKYNRSTLNDVPIKHLLTNEDEGEVTIVTDLEDKVFFVGSENLKEGFGADYILCSIQYEPGICILK